MTEILQPMSIRQHRSSPMSLHGDIGRSPRNRRRKRVRAHQTYGKICFGISALRLFVRFLMLSRTVNSPSLNSPSLKFWAGLVSRLDPVGKLLKRLNRHPYRPSHMCFMIMTEGSIRSSLRSTSAVTPLKLRTPYLVSNPVLLSM